MLQMIAGGKGGSLKEMPSIHSPLLTILLDVPWSRVMRSGWPIFGLLAQLSVLTAQSSDAPVVDGHVQRYYKSLRAGLSKPVAPNALAELGAAFVQEQEASEAASPEATTGRVHVMPALRAPASQLLGAEVLRHGRAEAALQHMQSFFRQAVSSISDLQGTVESSWPLHAVLHAVSVRLMQLESNFPVDSNPAPRIK